MGLVFCHLRLAETTVPRSEKDDAAIITALKAQQYLQGVGMHSGALRGDMRLTGFGTQARFHSGTTPHEIAKRLAVAIPFMINDPKDIAAGASRPQPEQPDHNPTPSLRPSLLPPSASASLAVPCSSVSRCLLSPFLARPQSLPLAPSLSAPPYPGLSAGPPPLPILFPGRGCRPDASCSSSREPTGRLATLAPRAQIASLQPSAIRSEQTRAPVPEQPSC